MSRQRYNMDCDKVTHRIYWTTIVVIYVVWGRSKQNINSIPSPRMEPHQLERTPHREATHQTMPGTMEPPTRIIRTRLETQKDVNVQRRVEASLLEMVEYVHFENLVSARCVAIERDRYVGPQRRSRKAYISPLTTNVSDGLYTPI